MKFALLTAFMLITTLFTCPMSTEAANEDDELSIMAAEQRKDNDANVTVRSDIEIFDNRPPTVESSSPVIENIPNAKQVEKKNIDTVDKAENLQESVGLSNPIVAYSNFEEAAKTAGFIPLYVPRKSGFAMNYIAVISGNIIEVRYGKRWEPTVTLSIRTYKRSPGEELKDISGVHGVKWKVDLSSGMTIYISRVSDNVNAAAWSVGQYTFAAMTENLSFAAFHSLIIEELVDLCNHYFISIH